MSDSFIQSSWTDKDVAFETPLRPQSLGDFQGQDPICERLKVFTQAALERKEALGHVLFSGPPGLGKTTLGHILSKTMGTNLVTTSGPGMDKPKDLAGVLTNLQEGDILFIDEMHRLPKSLEEYLYSAMEDFRLDLLIDSGPNARSVQVKLNPFTLVGATTRSGLISAPLRSRFAINLRLDYYPPDTLAMIIHRSARILHCSLEEKSSMEIAARSRGTPRIANNLLRWVRDYVQIHAPGQFDAETTVKALEMLCIDHKGLDETDKKILGVIIDHYAGGPVGLKTLSVGIGEESDTIEEVYEPYLIMQGFIKRTPRGREATSLAYEHMGRAPKQPIGDGA